MQVSPSGLRVLELVLIASAIYSIGKKAKLHWVTVSLCFCCRIYCLIWYGYLSVL